MDDDKTSQKRMRQTERESNREQTNKKKNEGNEAKA